MVIYGHFEAFKIFFLSLVLPLSIPNPTHHCWNKIRPALLLNALLFQNEKQVSLLCMI